MPTFWRMIEPMERGIVKSPFLEAGKRFTILCAYWPAELKPVKGLLDQ